MKTLTGIIRGKTIELAEAPGIAEGQQVFVQVTVVNDHEPQGQWPQGGGLISDWSEEDNQILATIQQERMSAGGRGFRASEGALADDPEWDRIMDEIQQSRR